MDTNVIREALQANKKVRVRFNKADGSVRDMYCCLTPDIVGESYEYKGGEKPANEDLQHVWDIEAKAWRAFKYSTLTDGSVV